MPHFTDHPFQGELVAPNTITRSEGKAKRVIDRREK